MSKHFDPEQLTRRRFLVAAGAGAGTLTLGGVLASCGSGGSSSAAADLTLRAQRSEIELGSRKVRTWTFGDQLPGRPVRLKQGKPVRIKLVNDLDEPTSIHWHGLRLRNPADGVPGFTQKAVAPGEEFVYSFTPPDAGTYFFHPHVGTQLDRGLYAPLIVEPQQEDLAYDQEAVLMFDDWLDGVSGTPDKRLADLRASGMNMGGMDMGGSSNMGGMNMGGSSPMGRMRHTGVDGTTPGPDSLARLANNLEAGRLDPGDVPDYPLYLVNGRPPEAPTKVVAKRGDRVRLRLINPSADTIFCVFVEGHELEVVRADGVAVKPVRTDALMLGMGERYDVLLDMKDSTPARIVGMPLGKRGRAVAVLSAAGSSAKAPAAGAPLRRLPKRVLSYGDLRPAEQVGSSSKDAPRIIRLDLAMGPGPYSWTIGGQQLKNADPIRVSRREHVRFVMRNKTKMPHPMHLHGHVFSVGGRGGPLKDTALSIPGRELALDWVADNPGTWAYHCHNVYHQEAGMMRRVEVT